MPGGRGDKSNMKGVSWQEDRKYLLIKGQSIHERSPVTVNAGEGVGHINDLQGPITLAMRAPSFSNSLTPLFMSTFLFLYKPVQSLPLPPPIPGPVLWTRTQVLGNFGVYPLDSDPHLRPQRSSFWTSPLPTPQPPKTAHTC